MLLPAPSLLAQAGNSTPSRSPQFSTTSLPPVPGDNSVAFRSSDPSINALGGPAPITHVDAATAGEGAQEMDSLTEQKQTLESELHYAKAKVDEARRRLDVESMAGHADAADKWQQEVKDWDTKVRDLQAQLSEVDNQVQGAMQQMQPSAQDSLILPGDNLEVYVVEDNSFNGRYVVRRGGYILIPQLGRIPMAGKSIPDGEAEIRKYLEANQLQHATVMVEKDEGGDVETGPVIYLAGEFKSPRPFVIPAGTKATVMSVILSSGGYTDKADLAHVRVMRIVENKSVVSEENVERILLGGGLSSDQTLDNGDVLEIPSSTANQIFVSGRVVRPGSEPLKFGDKLTVYAAILNAGGFARFAAQEKVYILRSEPDGTKTHIPINIRAVQRGRAADVPLVGDDIIVVPEKFFSF